ncbi:hypothetical protein [Rhodococcus xishaensis]|uniref:hypothetical protein n=1 Tax=Rhodococcus xishaensis TaxID=2487364 RepID=UPI0026D7BCF2
MPDRKATALYAQIARVGTALGHGRRLQILDLLVKASARSTRSPPLPLPVIGLDGFVGSDETGWFRAR